MGTIRGQRLNVSRYRPRVSYSKTVATSAKPIIRRQYFVRAPLFCDTWTETISSLGNFFSNLTMIPAKLLPICNLGGVSSSIVELMDFLVLSRS